MTPLRRRMIEDLRLRGYAAATQENYVLAVSLLARHYGRSPDLLTPEEIRAWILYRIGCGLSADTVNQNLCAIKFFFERTLGRDWEVWGLPLQKRSSRLPTVLSHAEVHEFLGLLPAAMTRGLAWTMYETGARLFEALALRPGDVDGERLVLRICRGKGDRERHVPLAAATLERLRSLWRSHRSRDWLFPGRRPGRPLTNDAVQKAFGRVRAVSGFPKRVTPHTLRHSYATHLLERGVNIRVVQQMLGHKNVRATLRYLHVTDVSHDSVRAAVEGMVAAR
jgi:integrase/recombinase XerD